ncbi:hypothetical protein [Cellulophaga sp. BC115SP]|uniref:hypothetical protein n=1 Tax=Cellulophaga sp. BC115SP TaxID=2683263 RepID=UPI001411CFE6|nr:hypothetical protein [Cellulophaga sp. BC115SP]NBB30417.1 hypothetical protein [Cellulophaga sp. BC115SP]
MRLTISFNLLLTVSLYSCTNQHQVEPNICVANQSKEISFKTDIIPILQKNCWSCHNAVNHSGGLVLETYQQVSEDAKSGELYDAIVPFNSNPTRMPKGGILSECEVATIKKWIDNKMPNN